MNKLSNQPPKGTTDWLPDEFAIRKYIFDTWRKVCTQFGYEEYLTPIVENADVYRAKSGEDVGGKELMIITDRAGRELSIRPEMTPSVTRLVSKIYNETPKPLRLFSIANFIRNEKPQRGRNREFWQLNFDIFGSDSLNADVEVLSMAIEIMIAFGANKDQFEVKLNSRKVMQDFLKTYLKIPEDKILNAFRILDKFEKIPFDQILARLKDEASAEIKNEDELFGYFDGNDVAKQAINEGILADLDSFQELKAIGIKMDDLYSGFGRFCPSLMRGLDYYDGIVFEVFDKHPDNNRSMFGGGRYNGLASIFGSQSFPAVGCAPGDETTKLFLEAWNLIPKNLTPEYVYIPLLDKDLENETRLIAKKLRSNGVNIVEGFEVERIGKALQFADTKKYSKVILFGEQEKSRGVYKIKNMVSGGEEEVGI